jgi:hypothetical protein
MDSPANKFRTRARLLFIIGCAGVAFFAVGQVTMASLGIHIVAQGLALVIGIVCLLSAWNSIGQARALTSFEDPARLLAHWSYSEEEWELYLQARGFTSQTQRKRFTRCDARITADGIYFSGWLRMWNGSAGGLCNVAITEGPIALLNFSYTLPRGGRTPGVASYEATVPIPRSRRKDAEALVEWFRSDGRLRSQALPLR